MRLIFMGTPEFSVQTLQRLARDHEIVACYTRAPKPTGRGMVMQNTPVHEAAIKLGIPVYTPASLKNVPFPDHDADAAVVVAYGLLLPQHVLNAPKFGCYNLHASLLPRWRGAAPLQRAIMAGDEFSGAMVMKMDIGLDTGDVALTYKHRLTRDETTKSLHDTLALHGAELIAEAMMKLSQNALPLQKQASDGVTYAAKITNAESELDFTKSPLELERQIRAIGGWFMHENTRLKVLKAEIARDEGFIHHALRLVTVQKAGSKPMSGEEYLRGLQHAAL
jgi:methionyl-tRNA formyltransferase